MNVNTRMTRLALSFAILLLNAGCGDGDDPVTPDPPDLPDPPAGYVLIPPSSVPMPISFTMGSTLEPGETPHQVTLTSRFFMFSTEVTNAQMVAALQWAYDQGYVTASVSSVQDALDGSTEELLVLNSRISFGEGEFSTPNPDRPVEDVSWYGAVSYCDWNSLQESLPRAYDHLNWNCNNGDPYGATGYRLPTEAEWEIACRAGTSTHFNTGDCLDSVTEANFAAGFGEPFNDCPVGPTLFQLVDVGSYLANQWGLYDMHGNAYELCNDWEGDYSGDATNPVGPESGEGRIVRGGNWSCAMSICRSACRNNSSSFQDIIFGFRPVRSVR